MKIKEDLIFDIGLHTGEDTAFYLKKGYYVVAVEANPVLADHCRRKFDKAIASGRLIILNAGIADKPGILPFYVNHYSSEWSSFDKAIGTRNNTKYEVIEVPCIKTESLFRDYGIPYYMKVDIEGYDYLSLNDIPDSGEKPSYVSCEATNISLLDTLKTKGYTRFKLINQANSFRPLNEKLEGKQYYILYRKMKHAVKHKLRHIIKEKYMGGSSGPFGEDTKGEWKTYDEIRHAYIDFNQGDLNIPVNYISWCDFHAAL
ncbi:MAG: FkbM family methyltransferase [Chitinophagaceae bacterium]|nr:FkbM family methyltransferase [Chitinophagaceae bacterium]